MHRTLFLLLALVLAGCAGPTTSDIAVSDNNAFTGGGRLAFDISPRPARPAEPHNGHAIELGFYRVKGGDEQDFGTGQPVIFGGRTFATPIRLTYDYEYRYAELAYRFRRFFGDGGFGIEALGGIGRAEFELTAASPSQRASEKLANFGIAGTFGLLWKLSPSWSVQSRLGLFWSGQNEDVTNAVRADAYLAWAFAPNIAVRAGYAGWGVRSYREQSDFVPSGNSEIRARFYGPALGLDVAF